ncbi:sensor histidine kinase [Corallibacter sp.]|uniref:sensor histidine kinase n=1 Tax=Corallibacter sp. TaxID=2038084 RepID=UPI003AB852FE
MNDSRYRIILYFIVTVILSTIAIQVYWNYKNYLANKQQLIKDVQVSLDKAVDDYYVNLAEQTTIGFAFEGNDKDDFFAEDHKFDSILKQIDITQKKFKNLDSLNLETTDGISIYRGANVDSILNAKWDHKKLNSIDIKKDSIKVKGFELLTSKVVISISNDTLDVKKIDSLITTDLSQKNITIDYKLDFNRDKTKKIKDTITDSKNILKVVSKSTLLPKGSSLNLSFENQTKLILKRIFGGILISTLLILAVISCLFYLLKIIKHQKQLAEVKNDLISNITHEFKTPIATIGVALESIQNFNVIEDKAKTKTYLDLSNTQLSKLNTMVEKLLETATLDSENLELNKDTYNISEILTTSIEKHQLNSDKTITFNIPENILAKVDVFHFENAINNIIDNAIKYGGDAISISLEQSHFAFTITISDNGNTLTKANKDKIFEKFYRVPKGNTHDVKGFGIGLYYTKKIAEKHNGTITVDLKNNITSFKITLPNA